MPRSQRLRFAPIALALLLTACGGGADSVAPPTITPASVAVVSGDGQEGEPGAIVGAVSVVVKSATGATMPGVAVQFTVDSGGGSVASPAATTDGNGVASSGRWTLGVEGPQALSATVAALPKAFARAAAKSAGTIVTIAASGGTVTFEKPSAVFNGLKISIPAGTYSTPVAWSVVEEAGVQVTLPAKAKQVGPILRISNGQGFALKPFSIAIPVRVGVDSAVAAFFRDPVTGTMELIPVVARTETSLVLMTQHVAADQMILPDVPFSAPGAASLAAAPGSVQIVLVAGALIDLRVRYNSSFRPGVDDWEFINYGSFAVPGGFCSGQTLTAIYHNYARKAAKGPLYGRYDSLSSIDQDNPRGIKLASVVQKTMNWNSGAVISQYLTAITNPIAVQIGGPAWVKTQMESLALALLVTGKGQQLAIYRPGLAGGHAVVAHALQWGTLFMTDPNEPGRERSLQFTDQQFVPFPFSSNASEPSEIYTQVFVLAASALAPARSLDALFGQMEAGTVGNGRFLDIVNQYRDPVDTAWRDINGTLVTASSRMELRTLCKACPYIRNPSVSEPFRGLIRVYNAQGGVVDSDVPDSKPGAEFATLRGTNSYGLLSQTLGVDESDFGAFVFHDFRWADIKTVDFILRMSPARPGPGEAITFTVENGGIGNASANYRWSFSDGNTVTTSFGERSVTRSFADPIGKTVTVELRDAKGALARSSIGIGVSAWRLTSITDRDSLLVEDTDGLSAKRASRIRKSVLASLRTAADDFYGVMNRAVAVPSAALIAVDEESGGKSVLRLRVLPTSTWGASSCCPVPTLLAGEMRQSLGEQPSVSYEVGPFFAGFGITQWSQSTADLNSGTLTGQFVANGTQPRLIKNAGTQIGPTDFIRITSTRSGTSMSGVIEVFAWFQNDEPGKPQDVDPATEPTVFRFPFTAVRLR